MVDIDIDTSAQDAIELFYFAYRAFTSHPDQVLAQRGLGRVHHRILYFVGRNPNLPVSKLHDTLRVSKQALNAPLRELVDLELIAVTTAAHDRRVRQLALTPGGRSLERQLTTTQVEHLQQAFTSAGKSAAAGWHKVMQGIALTGTADTSAPAAQEDHSA